MLELSKNAIFQRSANDAQNEVTERTVLFKQDGKKKFISALQSRNAIKEIQRLPEDNESLHIIARGNFPLFSIVPAIIEIVSPETVESLSIATLGFSKSNATDLLNLIESGKIKSVSLLCSVFFERQNPAEFKIMKQGLEARGQKIIALRAHAKIITMRLSGGRFFCVESSANLRSCHNIEQITIFQSKELHDFHEKWISDAIWAGGS